MGLNNAYWFPHDVDAAGDEKIILLIRKHGWAGYGIYWSLIERLHKNNNSLQKDYEGLAFDMRETFENIQNVIENFKLFRISERNFSSDRVAKNLKERKEKRQKAKNSAETRWSGRNAKAMRTHSEGNAIHTTHTDIQTDIQKTHGASPAQKG